MDYKEKYEQAINFIKDLYPHTSDYVKEKLDDFFPELRESEDEKIRKKIIALFKGQIPYTSKEDNEKFIAWLEKQGKKERDSRYKYLEKLLEADTIYQMAMNDAMVEEAKAKALEAISNMEIFELLGIEKQGEQKPDWSEEDEEMLKMAIKSCEQCGNGYAYYWLKSLKARCTSKPSDEQINALENFIRSVGESGYLSPYDNNTKLLYLLLEQLKKLK